MGIHHNWIDFISGFQEWIADKYHIKSSHKWSSIILFFEKDEAKGF